MKIAQAREIVEEFAALIRPACQRAEVAGSVRRGDKMEVKDGEIVVMPTLDYFTLLDRLASDGTCVKATYGGRGSHRWGNKYRGVVYRGLLIEVFCGDAANFGFIHWLRTGPGDRNQAAMQRLNERTPLRCIDGYVWYAADWRREGGGWVSDADRRRVIVPDESAWFELLGMPFVEPADRGRIDWTAINVQRDAIMFDAPVNPAAQQQTLF